jgi:hypothetical protein
MSESTDTALFAPAHEQPSADPVDEAAAPSVVMHSWSAEVLRKRRRHSLELCLVCTIGLIPWTVVLALTLPNQYQANHWRLTWVGFDVLLLLGMGITSYLGWRRRQAVIGAAIAVGTLLVCDAWFDISLDLGTSGVWLSLASALFIELPLAGFLIHRALVLMQLAVQHGYPQTQMVIPMSLRKAPVLAQFDLRDGERPE